MDEFTHKLTQVKSEHDKIRTKEILGCLVGEKLPTVGTIFAFVGAPLEMKVGFRLITTSRIKAVETKENGVITFETENSTYQLERLLNG